MNELTRIPLCDGVTLNYIATDKSKTDCISVHLLTPLEASRVTSNALVPRLLVRATEKYPTYRDVNIALDDLYGSTLRSDTAFFSAVSAVNFAMTVLRNDYTFDGSDLLSQAIQLLADLLFHPRTEQGGFPKSSLDVVVPQLKTEIEAQELNNKTSVALRGCIRAMCGDDPITLSPLGRIEDLEHADALALYQDYTKLLASARVELFYAGTADIDDVRSRFTALLPFAPRHAELPPSVSLAGNVTHQEINRSLQITQAKLVIGLRADHPATVEERHTMALLNEFFGGGVNSRLFANVREKLSLCYFCSSIPTRDRDLLFVVSGIEEKNYIAARDAILGELKAIQDGSFCDDELENARRSLINSYQELEDDPSALCGWYLNRILLGDTLTPAQRASLSASTTRAQIISLAKSYACDTVYLLKGGAENGNENL